MKGTRFLRTLDGFSDEIYIQRSQWNRAGEEAELYVNLYCAQGEGQASRLGYVEIRLPKPSRIPMPQYYRRYLETEWTPEARNEAFNAFTPHQHQEISMVVRSRDWLYGDEDQLSRLLEVCMEQLLTVGMEFFATVHDQLRRGISLAEVYRWSLDFAKRLE